MPRTTLFTGVLLILLGLVGYVASGMASITALIPAFFGLPIAVLGWLAQKPAWRRGGTVAAAVLAALGLLGSARGVPQLFTLLGGGEVARPGAVWSQSIMAVICLVLIVLVVKWLFTARSTERASPAPPAPQESSST